MTNPVIAPLLFIAMKAKSVILFYGVNFVIDDIYSRKYRQKKEKQVATGVVEKITGVEAIKEATEIYREFAEEYVKKMG